MIVEISGTIRLRFSIQILETKTQLKFVDPCCHVHFNAHKPQKTSTPTLLKTVFIFFYIFISLANFYRFAKKLFVTPTFGYFFIIL